MSSPAPDAPPASDLAVRTAPRARVLGWGIALALCLGATQVGPLRAPDLFWHLRCGAVILDQRGLPARDPLTHTAGERPWTHHEWAAQVLLAATDRVLGPWGLRALRALLVALTLLGIAWLLSRSTGSPAVLTGGVLLAWIGMQPHASLGPHLFGWVFLVWTLAGLITRPRPWRPWRYAVVGAVVVCWVNVHASALILPVLLGAQLGGSVVEQAWRRRWDPGALTHWGVLFGLVSLAALVQPEGIGLYRYALATPEIRRTLSPEWWPLWRADAWRAHPVVLLLYGGLVVAVVGMGLTRRARQDLPTHRFPGFWVAVTAVALAFQTRRLTFLAFVPLSYVARALGDARWAVAVRDRAGHLSSMTAHLVAGALLAAGLILSLPARGGVLSPHHLRRGRFPEAATRFLAATRLQGRLYNPEPWGGYLAYRLHPGYRTFIDGRWLLVGRRVLEDSRRLLERRQDVGPLVDRYHLEIFVQPTRRLSRTPPLSPARWRLAYVDEVAVVLVRLGPHYAANRDRICAWYRGPRARRAHARWPAHRKPGDGGPPPRAIRPVVADCPGG